MKFDELKKYLTEHNVFGMTASKRKNVIIYSFLRYFNKRWLSLKIKVDRKTKKVISAINKGKVYESFDEIKRLVEV